MKNLNHPMFDSPLLRDCLEFVKSAHNGQSRKSGEPSWIHLVETTEIVDRIIPPYQLDEKILMASLCHDLLEDTDITGQRLISTFGMDVYKMVVALTKVQNNQRATHQKILDAAISSPQVLFIKIADRLSNLRTLEFLPIDSQMRIAKETIDFYVPLALKLKLWNLALELDYLAISCIHKEKEIRKQQHIFTHHFKSLRDYVVAINTKTNTTEISQILKNPNQE